MPVNMPLGGGKLPRITPCLWFDSQAEEAAKYYCGIFPNSRIGLVTHYGEVGQEIHGRPPGSVLTVAFELDGQSFTALNGGPIFKFTEALSLQINCDTQAEMDFYWDRLSEGGDVTAQQCGWLKDKFGVSWQIAPTAMHAMLADPDQSKQDRVMAALFPMKRLDLAALQRAFEGV